MSLLNLVYANNAQTTETSARALEIARDSLGTARFFKAHGYGRLAKINRARAYAFLNRACELACVPLTQHYVETSNGDLDLVWVTYRPEAVPWSENCDPAAMIYLGSVDNLTEDQARSRAIGW